MSGVNKTRERILDVSADLFRRQGMAGTGIKQILRGADAPFGSLYHHFPGGKDELAAETIKRAGAQYAELVAGKLLAGPDLPRNIREAFAQPGPGLVVKSISPSTVGPMFLSAENVIGLPTQAPATRMCSVS